MRRILLASSLLFLPVAAFAEPSCAILPAPPTPASPPAASMSDTLVELPDQDFGTTARSAILALTDVQSSPSEAPKSVAVTSDGSVAETEHSIMAKSTGAPASKAPLPDAPRADAEPGIASAINDVETSFGASPADADAKMSQTVAMREAAVDSTEANLIMPTMEPGPMCELLSGLTGRLNALGQSRMPALRAAE